MKINIRKEIADKLQKRIEKSKKFKNVEEYITYLLKHIAEDVEENFYLQEKNGHKKEMLKMKTLAAGKFKAQCLALIDKVAQSHEELVVTKYGKPMVKVVPFNSKKDNTDKPLAGMATYVDDVLSPIDEEWEANS